MYDIAKNIMYNINMEERNQLFDILTNNIDLFEKLLPGSPLIVHIKYGEPLNHPIGIAYATWKKLKK